MRTRVIWFLLGVALAVALVLGLYQIPPIRDQVEWRLDAAMGIVRGWIYPGDQLPAMVEDVQRIPPTPWSTHTPAPTATGIPPTLTPTATPLPARVELSAPRWEKQDWNNCGPATLALGLRYFDWQGDQFDISEWVKPDRGDKNVNIDELAYFIRNQVGWLETDFRVGGTIEILKHFLAAGLPVIVEKGYVIESDGPDAGWAGHYMLLTGYDDEAGTFTGQDTFIGPDQVFGYEELDTGWRQFNRVFMYIYPQNAPPDLSSILGEELDPVINREHATEQARSEVEAQPEDPYAWFNLGTNLVYFERYREAAEAYDTALALGLPWRFTRYQFGPYLAYFHSGRTEDVLKLANATLERTSKAEESLLWRGWAEYRQGDTNVAIQDFQRALEINPNYQDALYALSFLGVST